MSSSMGSTRLPEEGATKIEVRCKCGKRYRVSPDKAGSSVRCKNCKLKIKVPGDSKISMRSRNAILEELGIKTDEAALKVNPGVSGQIHQPVDGVYRCVLCSAKLAGEDVRQAYGSEGLICSLCRAQMGGSAIEEPSSAPAGEGEKKKKKELDTWVRKGSERKAQLRAAAIGLLVAVGVACFANALFATSIVTTALVAIAAGGLAGWQIHRGYQPSDRGVPLSASQKKKKS